MEGQDWFLIYKLNVLDRGFSVKWNLALMKVRETKMHIFCIKIRYRLGFWCQRSRDTSNDIWMTVLHLLFSDALCFYNCFIHGFDDFRNSIFMKLITNTTIWNSLTFRYGKPSIALMNVYSDDHCWSSLKRAIMSFVVLKLCFWRENHRGIMNYVKY